MKERLRELGIKTTELSEYMRISRPSLYKYMELYEAGDRSAIPDNVLRTFKYVDRYKSLTKEQVVIFVICEFSDLRNSDKKEAVRRYILAHGPNDAKVALMYALATTSSLDSLAPYLADSAIILERPEIGPAELSRVAGLVNLKSNIIKNIPPTGKELEEAKKNLGDAYVERRFKFQKTGDKELQELGAVLCWNS